MFRSILIFILMLCRMFMASSQELLFSTGFNVGVAMQNDYLRDKDVLGPRFFSGNHGLNFTFESRFFQRIGIVAGLAQHKNSVRLRDRDFAARHGDFNVDMKLTNNYFTYMAGLNILQQVGRGDNFLYVNPMIRYNRIGAGEMGASRFFAMEGENIDITARYSLASVSYSIEAGIQGYTGSAKRGMLFLAVLYNWGQDEVLSVNYRITREEKSPINDLFKSNGSFLGLIFGYKLLFYDTGRW